MCCPLLVAGHDVVDLVYWDLKNKNADLPPVLKNGAGEECGRGVVGGQVRSVVDEVSGIRRTGASGKLKGARNVRIAIGASQQICTKVTFLEYRIHNVPAHAVHEENVVLAELLGVALKKPMVAGVISPIRTDIQFTAHQLISCS